eukprot:g4769.t1
MLLTVHEELARLGTKVEETNKRVTVIEREVRRASAGPLGARRAVPVAPVCTQPVEYAVLLPRGAGGFGMALDTQHGIVYVSGLVRGGPALSCGLIRRHDVLVAVNGARVGEGEELATDRDVKTRMAELCAASSARELARTRRTRLRHRLRQQAQASIGMGGGGGDKRSSADDGADGGGPAEVTAGLFGDTQSRNGACGSGLFGDLADVVEGGVEAGAEVRNARAAGEARVAQEDELDDDHDGEAGARRARVIQFRFMRGSWEPTNTSK